VNIVGGTFSGSLVGIPPSQVGAQSTNANLTAWSAITPASKQAANTNLTTLAAGTATPILGPASDKAAAGDHGHTGMITNAQPSVTLGTNLTVKGGITHDAASAVDLSIYQSEQDKDVLIKINDGGVVKTAMQIVGSDGGIVTMPHQSGTRAVSSSVQTIANATWTTIVYQAETYDSQNEMTLTNGTFTVKQSGTYLCTIKVQWAASNSSVFYAVAVYKNGTVYDSAPATPGSAFTPLTQSCVTTVKASAGDTISATVYQGSGGNEALEQYGSVLNINKIN
jgi:hypothetical protein